MDSPKYNNLSYTEFNECPACGSDWNEFPSDSRTCVNEHCSMEFYRSFSKVSLRKFFIKDEERGYFIWWEVDEHTMRVYTTNNGKIDTLVESGWLPFDVKISRLNILAPFA